MRPKKCAVSVKLFTSNLSSSHFRSPSLNPRNLLEYMHYRHSIAIKLFKKSNYKRGAPYK